MQSEEFKKAVGCFPTGVSVISTAHRDKLWGFTANSFVSVSLDPPLISFCLSKGSRSFTAFKEVKNFGVSILSNDQGDIAKNFAQKKVDKFSNVNYIISELSKSPLIVGATCFLECAKYEQFSCGDHDIFIGKVISTKIDDSKSPIVYFAKSYLKI